MILSQPLNLRTATQFLYKRLIATSQQKNILPRKLHTSLHMNSSATVSHLADNSRCCFRPTALLIFTSKTNQPVLPKAKLHLTKLGELLILYLTHNGSNLHASSEASSSKLPKDFKFILINISYLVKDPLNIFKENLSFILKLILTSHLSESNCFCRKHP